MQTGAIAFMLLELVDGKQPVVEAHEGITRHLRDDRGARNHVTQMVTINHGPARDGEAWALVPIDNRQIRRAWQVRDRRFHRAQGCLSDVLGVNDCRRDDAKADGGVLLDELEGGGALRWAQTLGVINANGQTPTAQDHRCRDNRPRPRPAAGFIDASDHAVAGGAGGELRWLGLLAVQP